MVCRRCHECFVPFNFAGKTLIYHKLHPSPDFPKEERVRIRLFKRVAIITLMAFVLIVVQIVQTLWTNKVLNFSVKLEIK